MKRKNKEGKEYTNKQIEEHGLKDIEKRSRKYHVDHIVPIKIAFDMGIPYYVESDIKNLRIISQYDNISKNGRLIFDLVDKDLFRNYIDKLKDYQK